MTIRPRRVARLLIPALVLVAAGWVVRPYLQASSLIIRAARLGGTPETLANAVARDVQMEDLAGVPTRQGAVRARVYRPDGGFRRTALLVPGVHAAGIDEVRLTGLARDLAATGVGVITMALPDLQQYRITPRGTDTIEDAVTFFSRRPDYAPDGRVGVIGISFAGGLSIVAAGRAPVRDRVAYVVSFGGHGDLPRVMRYLCTGIEPAPPEAHAGAEQQEVRRPPHDYGVAVVLYGVAELVVPPAQVQPLREGIRTFLLASQETLVDAARAGRMFQHARRHEETLPEPARTYLRWVNDRNVKALGPALLAHIGTIGGYSALSPERAPATPATPAAPVYLLHGADDRVIPAIESRLLGRYLEQRHTDVHVLLSGLITHAEVDRSAAASEALALVGFWGSVLRR